MRFVAMRLHTKDQAPKEGGKEASKNPMMAVCTRSIGDAATPTIAVAANSGGLPAVFDRVASRL